MLVQTTALLPHLSSCHQIRDSVRPKLALPDLSHFLPSRSSPHSQSPYTVTVDEQPSPRSPLTSQTATSGGAACTTHGYAPARVAGSDPDIQQQIYVAYSHQQDTYSVQEVRQGEHRPHRSSDSSNRQDGSPPVSPSPSTYHQPLSAPHSQEHFSRTSSGAERYMRTPLDARRMSEPAVFGDYANPMCYQPNQHNLPYPLARTPYLHRGNSTGSLRQLHQHHQQSRWKTEESGNQPDIYSVEEPISPLNPNFSGGSVVSPSLSYNLQYPPIAEDTYYGPSPPGTGTSTSSSGPVTLSLAPATSQSTADGDHGPSSKTYSFVSLPGNAIKKRPRRRYDEIERLYQCSWPHCHKSYGTLNHLNAHVTMQKHGQKRNPNEFKELRKQWRKQKKEADDELRLCHIRRASLCSARSGDEETPPVRTLQHHHSYSHLQQHRPSPHHSHIRSHTLPYDLPIGSPHLDGRCVGRTSMEEHQGSQDDIAHQHDPSTIGYSREAVTDVRYVASRFRDQDPHSSHGGDVYESVQYPLESEYRYPPLSQPQPRAPFNWQAGFDAARRMSLPNSAYAQIAQSDGQSQPSQHTFAIQHPRPLQRVHLQVENHHLPQQQLQRETGAERLPPNSTLLTPLPGYEPSSVSLLGPHCHEMYCDYDEYEERPGTGKTGQSLGSEEYH